MPLEQIDLIKRTDEELRKSIEEKRQKFGPNTPLDPEEAELLLRQIREAHDETEKLYPEHRKKSGH